MKRKFDTVSDSDIVSYLSSTAPDNSLNHKLTDTIENATDLWLLANIGRSIALQCKGGMEGRFSIARNPKDCNPTA